MQDGEWFPARHDDHGAHAKEKWWRRRELNPRPQQLNQPRLHAYPNVCCRPRDNGPAQVPQRSRRDESWRSCAPSPAPPSLLSAFAPHQQASWDERHSLGCEGQLFVSFYVFGSGFNEANEPSSACRFWRHHRVETGAPPQEPARGQSAAEGVWSRPAANNGALPWPVRGSVGTA